MSDLERIKAELEEKLRELIARAEDIDDDLSEPGDDDWEEQATESAGDEVMEAVGKVTLDEIRQIRSALARIEAGKYGVCSACGKSIPAKRLDALPYATKCVKCS